MTQEEVEKLLREQCFACAAVIIVDMAKNPDQTLLELRKKVHSLCTEAIVAILIPDIEETN